MFAWLLRRPIWLLVPLMLIAVVGGAYMRERQKAATASLYPMTTPEAKQALEQQLLQQDQTTQQLKQGLEQQLRQQEQTTQQLLTSTFGPENDGRVPGAPANAPQNVPQYQPQYQPQNVPQSAPQYTPQPGTPAPPTGPQLIGIPSEALDVTYSSQRNSKWCWAASIQMVLQYHGIRTMQQDIVARTFGTDAQGNLPNQAGDLANITSNLNNLNVDRAGTTYQVESVFGEGAPPIELLLDNMERREPLIIGYRSGPNMGHAVVITGVQYSRSPQGPVIHKLIVRDPWPSDENRANAGRVEYDAREFAQKITGYWQIRVRR